MALTARNTGLRKPVPAMVMPFALVWLLCMSLSNTAGAQAAAGTANRADSFVAMSRSFAFFSDPVMNLHDFLLWNARSLGPVESAADCLAALPPGQRNAFGQARDFYATTFPSGAGERLLLALRYRLAGFGDLGLTDATELAAAVSALELAAPAYQTCWWQRHDARNRRWIADVLALLVTHENALHTHLQQLYGADLPRPLPVDVVGYASFNGADSVTDPDHLRVSSVRAANSGLSALEILFHEASHTIFGPRVGGPLWEALQQAAAETPLPREFWHALLFFTTGQAVQARLAAEGVADYRPYAYSEGLFERSWPTLREPLERVWPSYVDGAVPMAEAAQRIVEALAARVP